MSPPNFPFIIAAEACGCNAQLLATGAVQVFRCAVHAGDELIERRLRRRLLAVEVDPHGG